MKAKILDKEGKARKEIKLPVCFSGKIRPDIAQKVYEANKKIKWKTAAGRGISRVPRKVFWRRGSQFYWAGATLASVRGGRRAHPPKLEHFLKKIKVNKKEFRAALVSALSATSKPEYLKRRYETLVGEIKELPLVIDEKILKLKTKEFFSLLKKILKENYKLAEKKKKIRAGKGKMRGRKYKKTAGLLLVIGKNEKAKFSGIDIRKISELSIADLYPLGRLVIYTEQAIQDLSKLFEKKEKEEK